MDQREIVNQQFTHDEATSRPVKALFVAYYYPPAAGPGLPGTMRSVKFIRNLDNAKIHVLSNVPARYGPNIKLDLDMELPINCESIHRVPGIDFFRSALRFKARLASLIAKRSSSDAKTKTVFSSMSDSTNPISSQRPLSTFQKLKDFIYHLFYFPDQESPWILRAALWGRRIVVKEKLDVIFATGSPWSALAVGYLISILTGRPLVADFRDPWVNNPFHLSKGKLLDGFASLFERRIVQRAAVVSLNTDPLREDFIVRYPEVPANRFVVLPNGFDPQDFSWIANEPLRRYT